MRIGLTSSFLTHAAVIMLAQFGLPGSCTPDELVADIVPVQLVTSEEAAAMMAPPVVPPEQITPPEEIVEVTEPEPDPDPEPEPVVEVPEPEPEPEPEPQVKVEPEPDPAEQTPPENAVVEIPQPPDIVPERRPTPPDQPAEIAEVTEAGDEQPDQNCEAGDFICEMAALDPEREIPAEAGPDENINAPGLDSATRSELDRIRRLIIDQVSGCWVPPTGAVRAEELVVKIRVRLNADGGVENVSIVNQARMNEPYFRSAAEAAMRAVLNPSCNPLNLPAESYDVWQDLQITFNPAEMLG
jgi:hypothetical protein